MRGFTVHSVQTLTRWCHWERVRSWCPTAETLPLWWCWTAGVVCGSARDRNPSQFYKTQYQMLQSAVHYQAKRGSVLMAPETLTQPSSYHPEMSQKRCPAASYRCGSSQHWTHQSIFLLTRCSIVLHPPAVKVKHSLHQDRHRCTLQYIETAAPPSGILMPVQHKSPWTRSHLHTFSKPQMSQQNIWAHGWVFIMIFPSFWDLVAKYSLPFIALRL